MSEHVFCQKLQQELPALGYAPFPGELGIKIQQHISERAWQLWLEQQTMLINEYRLNLMDPQSRDFLIKEMERFLFEGADNKPEGYVPPESDS